MQQLMFLEPGRLEWQETPEPALEGPGEALVRPVVVANCDLDRTVVAGKTPFAGPFPIGHEFVAEVAEVGAHVRTVRSGDLVVVPWKIACGVCERCAAGLPSNCKAVPELAMYGLPIGGAWGSALSDLVRVPFADAMLVPVPSGMSPETIASMGDNLPDAWRTVAPPLRERPGAEVLVVGGSPSLGLYAAGMAIALGAARVDYVDRSPERRAAAEAVGARVFARTPDVELGRYPITVNASASPSALALALRSTAPGGICTSVGIYSGEVPLPLLDMYTTGVTFKTGVCHARSLIPEVLDFVRSGRFHPERLTSRVVPWKDAAQAWQDLPIKVVVVRDDAR